MSATQLSHASQLHASTSQHMEVLMAACTSLISLHAFCLALTFSGRNLAPVEGGERPMRSVYLPPFQKACAEAGALSFMTAYSAYDGIPVVSDSRTSFMSNPHTSFS